MTGSHLSCQSGGVHDSNSVPGASKYKLRNSCSLPGGTVAFGCSCERLRKADNTTSAGKKKEEAKTMEPHTGLIKKSLKIK